MNTRGQITMETMAGFALFILLFIGVSQIIFSENNYIDSKSQEITKKDACTQLAQAFYETKNNKVSWRGTVDWNYYVSTNTIYVDYNPSVPFSGVYCETLNTNLAQMILKGDLNLSYNYSTGFLIQQ